MSLLQSHMDISVCTPLFHLQISPQKITSRVTVASKLKALFAFVSTKHLHAVVHIVTAFYMYKLIFCPEI